MPATQEDFSQPIQECRSFRRRLLTVVFLGAASLGLYVLLSKIAAGLALAEPSFAGEIFPWIKILTKEALTALQQSGAYPSTPARFFAICAGLFAIYGWALKIVNGSQSLKLQGLLFGAGAAFLLAQLFAPIMLSSDLYGYAVYGRVLAAYGANPYSAAPPISPSDPFMPLWGREFVPSVYGPLWTLTCGGLTWLSGERIGLTVLLFRGVVLLAALATGALLWNNLRRTAPEKTAQGLVLFLWNPLLVIETGLSGHNDAGMLALMLLAIWLHLRGWRAGAVVALTLSALIKFMTGMLIPLYMWMVLRQPATWRERAGFIARSALGAAAVSIATLAFAHADSDVPATHVATAPDFYDNNFHELILKGIRRCLGEDAESIRVPIYFQGWWIAARTNTFLHAAPSQHGEIRADVTKGDKLLVIAPQTTEWARVYDLVARRKGYVESSVFEETSRPVAADTDLTAKWLEKISMEWPTVRTANAWVRAITWLLFGLFGLLAAWRTTNFEQFLVWSGAVLIASYYLILTQIWPWYITWAVAIGAMAPARLPAKFAMLLSASVLTLYVTIGFAGSDQQWVYTFRSVPAFVLPAILFLVFRRVKL